MDLPVGFLVHLIFGSVVIILSNVTEIFFTFSIQYRSSAISVHRKVTLQNNNWSDEIQLPNPSPLWNLMKYQVWSSVKGGVASYERAGQETSMPSDLFRLQRNQHIPLERCRDIFAKKEWYQPGTSVPYYR